MGKIIKLRPYNCVTGRASRRSVFYDYLAWRRSDGYRLWVKRQWAKQAGRCFYCDCSLSGRQHNVDHVLPISRRGQNRAKNFVLACPACNMAKGAKRPSRPVRSAARKAYAGFPYRQLMP